jgi:hypothetical protein
MRSAILVLLEIDRSREKSEQELIWLTVALLRAPLHMRASRFGLAQSNKANS